MKRRLVTLIGSALAVLLAPWPAYSQTVPAGGHAAARASDTGFEGAVNSQGGYSASVPLDLPSAHGGLPLPLSIVYGGNRFGAAGQSWDIPLSYIRRDTTLTHHRPVSAADASPQAREQLSLTLNGQRTDLVRNAADTAWVARRDGAQLEVRSQSNTLVMYDGNGLTYNFSAQGASVGSTLDNGNLYLLRSIVGPGGNKVTLSYDIGAPALPGGGTGLSINLARLNYNPDSTGTCSKHQINLNYDTAVSSPLAISMLGNTVLARVQKLLSLDVTAKATCADANVSLRKYTFAYQTDADTGRAQLQGVTMIGQAGTPERNVTLPVVSAYTYGKAAESDGTYVFSATQIIGAADRPSGMDTQGIAGTLGGTLLRNDLFEEIKQVYGDNVFPHETWQNLIDLNGDGRPDLVYRDGDDLRVSYNTASGSNTHFDAVGQKITGVTGAPTSGPLELRTSPFDRSSILSFGDPNQVLLWRQMIDVNGDGRLDLIDALEEIGSWVVYLNTPSPTDPRQIKWERRTISTASIEARLREAGFHVPPPSSHFDYLPLGRQTSGRGFVSDICYRWQSDPANGGAFGWVDQGDAGFSEGHCPARQTQPRKETTTTEWELRDVNGDGYPDFVYNASPMKLFTASDDRPAAPGNPGEYQVGHRTSAIDFDPQASADIKAMLNVAGVHLSTSTSAFAAPTLWIAGGAPGSVDRCGIQRTEEFGGTGSGEINLTCGLQDVNGDGLADRLTIGFSPDVGFNAPIAHLGTGDVSTPFSSATIAIPGFLGVTNVDMSGCPDPSTAHPIVYFPNHVTSMLRDVTGDGIPDYVDGDIQTNQWTLSVGTGTGFAPPKVFDLPQNVSLSHDEVSCAQQPGVHIPGRADTVSGLYDLDGDGRPEVLDFRNGTDISVFQLSTVPNASGHFVYHVPVSGRLIKVDNGYGASTAISYRSAKEDTSTKHLLPYPEIVVTSVDAVDTAGNTPLVTPSLSAYGGAEQIFDPAYDAFRFPGYQRAVSLRNTGDSAAPNDGMATIHDTYALAPIVTGSEGDSHARFLRYLKTGRSKDATTLSGNVGTDPWALLAVDAAHDARRIAGTHSDWDARLLPIGLTTGAGACTDMLDMLYPYDFTKSSDYRTAHASDSFDQCVEHGFAFQTLSRSFRGTPGTAVPPTDQTVMTESDVLSVDDYGRVTQVLQLNDLLLGNADDLCVTTEYAVPMGTNERVLNAPATRTVTNSCDPAVTPTSDPVLKTFAKTTWEYDTTAAGSKLPAKHVSKGFVTSQVVSRFDLDKADSDAGHLLNDIRLFDATFDATGNPLTVTKTRDDGATSKITTTFDPFGLTPLTLTSDATNADGSKPPALVVSTTPDPLTLNTLSTTDANGAKSSNTYDGFSRVVLSKVTPIGGTEGVLSSMTYNGFALNSGSRNIVQKVFTDAVPVGNVGTAAGRIGTVYLDSLGRQTKTEAQLGTDYANKKVILGQRTYDALGRVVFQADPFVSTDSFSTAYGTTYKFNTDGTPRSTVRGPGMQARDGVVDEANELYTTFFGRSFANNHEIVSISAPDSLNDSSNQSGISRETISSAIGRVLEYQTTTAQIGNPRVEDVTYTYDALGNRTSMRRYLTPDSQSAPITTTWHFDSLGWVTKLEEPDTAAQRRNFDTWGELTSVTWCDSTVSTCSGTTVNRSSITQYDALGRTTHREDQSQGITVPETVNDYTYDVGVNTTTPAVTATNVLGRLASATSPTSSVAMSYDALGRANAQVFTDRTVSSSNTYVQKMDLHTDGSPQTLHLLLPDNAFKDEKVDYTFDSAGRTRSVTYNDGTNQSLFTTAGSTDIDVFGRIRTAQYGAATFTASYADTGRRLLNDIKVNGAAGTSREISFAPIPNTADAAITVFDPVGRERARTEFKNGIARPAVFNTYDNLGRLSATSQLTGSVFTTQRQFTYDPLGNVLQQDDPSASSPTGKVSLRYQTAAGSDLDRLCSVGYSGIAAPSTCNVTYDGVGNIASMPAAAGGTRSLTYFPSGQVKTIDQGSTHATFNYDAFGAVQQLVLNTATPDGRHDKHFGGMISRRDEGGVGVVTRTIPAPGLVATRHGPAGNWTFAFGESRGSRFVTDQNGAFVEDMVYQPYGELIASLSTGATPGTTNYTTDQWNGGDNLAALGITQLGARLYDPVIGRFLSRDPLIIPRTAATTNPYAFAMNDPINGSDPSGMDPVPDCGGDATCEQDADEFRIDHGTSDTFDMEHNEYIEFTGYAPVDQAVDDEDPLGANAAVKAKLAELDPLPYYTDVPFEGKKAVNSRNPFPNQGYKLPYCTDSSHCYESPDEERYIAGANLAVQNSAVVGIATAGAQIPLNSPPKPEIILSGDINKNTPVISVNQRTGIVVVNFVNSQGSDAKAAVAANINAESPLIAWNKPPSGTLIGVAHGGKNSLGVLTGELGPGLTQGDYFRGMAVAADVMRRLGIPMNFCIGLVCGGGKGNLLQNMNTLFEPKLGVGGFSGIMTDAIRGVNGRFENGRSLTSNMIYVAPVDK